LVLQGAEISSLVAWANGAAVADGTNPPY
jgi:hypothetical protein